MKRIQWILALLLCFGITLAPNGVRAAYPEKPINYMIVFKPGGLADILSRTLQPFLEKELGVPLVMINKPGAGGGVGTAAIAHAKPDGYTIGMVHEPPYVNHVLLKKANYKLEDIAYIGQVSFDESAMAVHKDSPIDSIEDFVEAFKKKPGGLKIGMPGIYGDDHLAYLLFEKAVGIKGGRVPFQGFGDVQTALAGHHIDACFGNVGHMSLRKDLFKFLFTMGTERSKYLPETPTLKEKGYNAVMGAARAIATSSRVPAEALQRLRQALLNISKNPEALKAFEKINTPMIYKNPEETEAYMNAQKSDQIQLFKELGEL